MDSRWTSSEGRLYFFKGWPFGLQDPESNKLNATKHQHLPAAYELLRYRKKCRAKAKDKETTFLSRAPVQEQVCSHGHEPGDEPASSRAWQCCLLLAPQYWRGEPEIVEERVIQAYSKSMFWGMYMAIGIRLMQSTLNVGCHVSNKSTASAYI